jgi:hypothetical protein
MTELLPPAGVHRYPMAPLIRYGLLALYGALVLPLPLLAPSHWRWPVGAAVLLGFLLVLAATSEQVEIAATGLRVGYPAWCHWLLRRGWSLTWGDIEALNSVATSQGGRVFYVRACPDATGRSQSWLLPQRIAHFEDFLARFSAATGLDVGNVQRLTPPWTYQLLAVFSGLLLLFEALALFGLPHPVIP